MRMSEPEVLTDPEVVSEQVDTLVIYKDDPGIQIESNIAALKARVLSVLKDYQGAEYGARDLRDARHDRAAVNGIKKEIHERYLQVKRHLIKYIKSRGIQGRAAR